MSAFKVASGKPKRKHCSKRISQEQEEKENTKKSRPFKKMPYRRAPVFLLSPGINTRRTTLPSCWIYSKSRGLVSTNQTFFTSEIPFWCLKWRMRTTGYCVLFDFIQSEAVVSCHKRGISWLVPYGHCVAGINLLHSLKLRLKVGCFVRFGSAC